MKACSSHLNSISPYARNRQDRRKADQCSKVEARSSPTKSSVLWAFPQTDFVTPKRILLLLTERQALFCPRSSYQGYVTSLAPRTTGKWERAASATISRWLNVRRWNEAVHQRLGTKHCQDNLSPMDPLWI